MKQLTVFLVLLSCAVAAAGQSCTSTSSQTCTPNLNLYLPFHGSYIDDWEVPLNANTTMLDQLLSGNRNLTSLSFFNGISSSPVSISESINSCCNGFLELTSGLHLQNTLAIDFGTLELGTGVQTIPVGLVYQDGGFNIVVQPGPRGKEAFPITSVSITSNVITVTASQLEPFTPGDVVFLSGLTESFINGSIVTVSTSNGTNSFTAAFTHANFTNASESRGLAETNFIKANTTLVLPDLAQGTSTPNSGFLAGILPAVVPGNCTFYGGFGILQDSGFGCNTHINFPDLTHAVIWNNGINQLILRPTAVTGARNISPPDLSGTMGVTGNSTNGFYQSKKGVSGCTTTASIGGVCASAVSVSWPTSFADTNYAAGCSASGAPTNLPGTPYVVSKSTGSMTVNYFAISAAAASWATIDCWGVHD